MSTSPPCRESRPPTTSRPVDGTARSRGCADRPQRPTPPCAWQRHGAVRGPSLSHGSAAGHQTELRVVFSPRPAGLLVERELQRSQPEGDQAGSLDRDQVAGRGPGRTDPSPRGPPRHEFAEEGGEQRPPTRCCCIRLVARAPLNRQDSGGDMARPPDACSPRTPGPPTPRDRGPSRSRTCSGVGRWGNRGPD